MAKLSTEHGTRIANLINSRDVATLMLAVRDANGNHKYSILRWRSAYDRAVESLRDMGIPIVA